MKRFTVVCLIALSSLIFLSSDSFAQLGLKVGPRFGTDTKNGDFFAGAQVELKILMITLAPNAEYYFDKDAKIYHINLDGQYTLFSAAVAKVFVGGGYTMQVLDPDKVGADDPNSKANSGFNIQAGGKAGLAGFELFALVKHIRINGKGNNALVAGLNFGF